MAGRSSSLLRLLLVASVVAGCGGGTTPEPVTRETPTTATTPANTPPPAAEPTPEQTPPPTPASQEAKPARDDQPVVVDPGEDGDPKSLVDAARAEKERRAGAGQSTHVI